MQESRICPRCGKRLARLNPGPECFSCQMGEPEGPPRRRTRRTRLPHEEILQLYQEIGNTGEVASRLGLARSSVWHVIKRAEAQGLLGGEGAPGGGDDEGMALEGEG